EMEHVTQALLDNKVANKESAYDILMRGLIQLPNYLDHLALGYPDIPMALLPLLNKLRALRRQAPLPATSLFTPDLSVNSPAAKPAPKMTDIKLRQFVHRLRASYHKGLTLWLKGPNRLEGLKTLLMVMGRLQQVTGVAPLSKVWWISEALLEALAQKGLPPNNAVNNLLKQTDGLIKRIVDHGNAALHVNPPPKFVTQLLHFAAHAKSKGPRISAVKRAFELACYLPTQAQLQAAQQIFSGPDIELMHVVVSTVQDDFARVEETLDIFARADNPDMSDLLPLVEILHIIAHTLRLLGLEHQCKSMLMQAKVIAAIGEGKKPHDLPQLLAVADALLKINAALDTLGTRGTHAREQIQRESGLLETQFKAILGVVVEEAKTELAEMIQPIINYLETGKADDDLLAIPGRFKQIEGLLQMLSEEQAVRLIAQCRQYVSAVLIKQEVVPAEKERKAFADTIVSLEFYLDTLAGNPMDGRRILNTTRNCLRILIPQKRK
ncbi:MAG: hypothetical protein GY862_26235, partial [Gammaproteobacteria bacterium]|nr:hypothetical protein [Gammaproteobacteria bacterium]